MKKFLFTILVIILLFSWYLAENSILNLLNIPPKEFNSSKWVTRFEIIKILNLSDCFDCINPSNYQKNQLSGTWWQKFKNLPSSNFDDIFYPQTIYNWQNYYRCVAYGAKKRYIHWFPRQISPICPWKYCWEKLASMADFFQIVFNILADKIYKKYKANRQQIHQRLLSQDKSSPQYRYFNLQDLTTLNQALKNCFDNNCQIKSKDEFIVYIKFCTYNLDKCWFEPIWNLTQWQWPISELNILLKENIFSKKQLENLDFNLLVPKKLVYQTFLKLKEKNDCNFDLDYDNDNILNNQDNCPNSYNPNQKDTDKDWIWDVCDDDIDWDKIKNPIGVVDFKWNIVVSKIIQWKEQWKYIDNCIFIPNTKQIDINKNGIWDKCENNSLIQGIYIKATPLSAKINQNIDFQAITIWKIKNIKRLFWDGKTSFWTKTIHKYKKAWIYTVKAIANFEDWTQRIATLTITILDNKPQIWFYITCNPLNGKKPLTVYCQAKYKWEFDKIYWILDNNKRYTTPSQQIKNTFLSKWIKKVQAFAIKDWKPIAESQLNIWVYDNKLLSSYKLWSYLYTDKLLANINEKINFYTVLTWFSQKDIYFINRNFWDWYETKNNKLNLSYYYTTPWAKKVHQKIILKNGEKLENILTLNITDNTNKDKGIYLQANPLYQKVNEYIQFKTQIKNITPSEISKIIRYFGDGYRKIYTSNFNKALFQKYSYLKPWIYEVKIVIYTKNNTLLQSKAIINIYGNDICSQENIKTLKCDLDNDWIPDLCDEDIDGDGIKNLLGLLKFELPQCNITKENINLKILNLETTIIKSYYKKNIFKPELDNCPFIKNTQQLDLDLNWIWDICENKENNTKPIQSPFIKGGSKKLKINNTIPTLKLINNFTSLYLGR